MPNLPAENVNYDRRDDKKVEETKTVAVEPVGLLPSKLFELTVSREKFAHDVGNFLSKYRSLHVSNKWSNR